jgi:uncharacterized protein YjiS (DUF1127 family)
VYTAIAMPSRIQRKLPERAPVIAAEPSLLDLVRDIRDFCVQSMKRWRERRQLLTLDTRLVKDMGFTRSDIYTEVAKPFWR